jgi:hypothetical protein
MQPPGTPLRTYQAKYLVASFLLGCLATALVAAMLVIPAVRENWHSQGQNEGRISALTEVTEKVKKNFATHSSPCLERGELASVKTHQVLMVECDGTMTLRVVE